MVKYFGYELPFADFNESKITYELNREMSTTYDYFYVRDSESFNVLANYADKLLDAGFTYSSYGGGEYPFTTPTGKRIYVKFAYDAEKSANEIRVEMPKFQDEVYLLANKYVEVNGFPAEHVATTLQNDLITGVNNDGVWYELFELEEGDEDDDYDNYYKDLLATEGSYSEQLAAQIVAAGYIYDEDQDEFFDANHDVEIALYEKDGFTRVNFFGPYTKDLDAAWFEANGFTLSNCWPSEIVDAAYAPGNSFAGANVDGDWYYQYEDDDYYAPEIRRSGQLMSQGNFVADIAANLVAAGYVYYPSYGVYLLPTSQYSEAYVYVSLWRGYTVVEFYGEYLVPTYTAAEAKAAMEAFFASEQVNVTVAEYAVADANAYFSLVDTNVASKGIYEVDVYESSAAEMTQFAAALYEGGWTIGAGQYEGDYVATFGDTGATIEIQDWIDYSYGCVRLICYVDNAEPVPAPETPFLVAATLSLNSFEMDVTEENIELLIQYEWIWEEEEDVWSCGLANYFNYSTEDYLVPVLTYYFSNLAPKWLVQTTSAQLVDAGGQNVGVAYASAGENITVQLMSYIASNNTIHYQFTAAYNEYFQA